MAVLTKNNRIGKNISSAISSNLPSLVGKNIDLISEQFKGKPLTSRVVLVNDMTITIDKSIDTDQLDKLSNNQEIIVQFDFNGQRISVNGVFYRTLNRRYNIELGDKLVPLSRRRYVRYRKSHQIKCATMPTMGFSHSKMSRLRWLETESINISSGGTLMMMPANLAKNTYLIMNLKAEEIGFPNLLIAQVKHSTPADGFNYNVGVEFIVNEHKEKHFPLLTIRRLSPNAFQFDTSRRVKIEKNLNQQMQNIEKEL